jgi:hypothetical protein
MGRPRKPITEHKRTFSVSLTPEQLEGFEKSLLNLQEWVIHRYGIDERTAKNAFTRSSLFGEIVDLISSPEGYLMLQGVIGNSLRVLGVKPLESDTRSFLDE